jgi:DNA (cytosine-5)-methyltransferase 1
MRTAVSLFAGVGGFDLALERAGIKVVASVEWDKKAQEVLKKHFPKSEIFGDIQGVTGEQLRAAGFDPSNGIITGGFPCQDLSVAGKRAGLAGKRSGLFWEICRLLDETRSQTVILENVPGLLSSNNGGDMAVVIEALVERGYRVGWRVLDAQHFGVPQRRRRVFIVGCLGNDGRSPEEILALSESRARYLETSREKRKNTSRSVAESAGNSSINSKILTIDGTRVGDVRVSDDQTMQTVIQRWGTGGGNVPMVAKIIGTLQARDYKGLNHEGARDGKAIIGESSQVRRLTPTECERLQGFPDGWTEGQADSHRYKQMGNAVAVPVVQWLIDRI